MTIVILTAGTRGDVQPYLALAHGLMKAGHVVRLAAPSNFETFANEHGVPYAPLRADYYQLMDSPEGQALKSGNPLRVMKHMRTTIFPLMRRLLDDSWEASRDATCLIYHPKVFSTAHIAEKLGIPALMAATVPIIHPTAEFPAAGVIHRNLGGFLNKLTYQAAPAAMSSFNSILSEWRQDKLGLPAKSNAVKGFTLNGKPIPVLYNFSQHLIPRPADWDDSAYITGFWLLDNRTHWQPPADLTRFIESGAPPVYIGFGSMVAEDPARLTEAVIEGLKQSGQRGVVAAGWGGIRVSDVPESIYLLKEAPHEWLFPRMAAVVHHGGAGTTAAGLLAGKPTIIIPFIADQPFWGNRIAALGAGPAPIPQKQLTAAKLSQAIREAVSNMEMQRKAAVIGEKLRAEDGVSNAVAVIEQKIQLAREKVAV